MLGTPTRAWSAESPYSSQQREILLCFKFLTEECSCIDHGKTCYIAGDAATQGQTFPVAACGFLLYAFPCLT